MNNETTRRKSASVPTVKKKRYMLLAAGGILYLLLFLLLREHSLKIEYSSLVAAINLSGEISHFQKEQISEAYKKTVEKSVGKNIGYLGMVYNANTIYVEASKCYSLASERDRNSWKWQKNTISLKTGLSNSWNSGIG